MRNKRKNLPWWFIFSKKNQVKDKDLRLLASFLQTWFSFMPEILKFFTTLGHTFKANMNVRNKGKTSHCAMIFPLEFEVGSSAAVKFYQFKTWETCLGQYRLALHKPLGRQPISFLLLNEENRTWTREALSAVQNSSSSPFCSVVLLI